MKSAVFGLAMGVGVVVPAMAIAEEMQDYPLLEDEVVMNLQTEGWVTTEDARVGVQFTVVQQKETASEIRQEILDKLKKFSPDARWHVTSTNQSKDQTGLNRWYVAAEARLHEKYVAGLRDKAEEVSRPGFKATINYVNFAPSLETMQGLMGELRGKIYKMAAAEAKRLNTAFEGAKYRVRMVDFVGEGMPSPRLMARPAMQPKMAMAEMDARGVAGQSSGGAQMPVSRKAMLTATVVLGQMPQMKK